jgi:hypothetical protein
MEFSANGFLDVYEGHVNTLNYILAQRPDAFHIMMADIYSQARCVQRMFICALLIRLFGSALMGAAPAQIAQLPLEDLDG